MPSPKSTRPAPTAPRSSYDPRRQVRAAQATARRLSHPHPLAEARTIGADFPEWDVYAVPGAGAEWQFVAAHPLHATVRAATGIGLCAEMEAAEDVPRPSMVRPYVGQGIAV